MPKPMDEKETVAEPVTPQGENATVGDLDKMTGSDEANHDYDGKNDDGKGIDHSK